MLAALALAVALASPVPVAPDYPPAVAVVTRGASTNTLGYTLAVTRDGRVDVANADAPLAHPALTRALVDRLYADLDRLAALDALPPLRCAKSVSFGTTTTVTFGGRTSPDLSCAATGPAALLAADVQAILADAHVVVTARSHAP